MIPLIIKGNHESSLNFYLEDISKYEVDDCESKKCNYKTNHTIHNGIFSFSNLTGITRRSSILQTTDDNHHYCDEANYAEGNI